MTAETPAGATHFDGRAHLRHEDGQWLAWCPGWQHLCDDEDLFRWPRTPQPLTDFGDTAVVLVAWGADAERGSAMGELPLGVSS